MLTALTPAFIMLVPIILLGVVLVAWKKHSKHFRGRSPLTRDLLRSPGESLRCQIEELDFEITLYMVITPLLPLYFYSAYMTVTRYRPSTSSLSSALYTVIAFLGMIYLLNKLMGLIKRRHKLSIGLDAELAVAQELNELMLLGHRVFHDFPADKFNIDHIVVGESGIYAVETKGRTKPVRKNGQSTWEVSYDGSNLDFPGWRETRPLAQAKDQAMWLQEWLSSAIGERLTVKPVLVLPGWFIKRTSPRGIWVCNGKNMQTLLRPQEGGSLSPKVVQQIIHQLDQRCRNVKPTGAEPDGKQ